MIEGPMMQTCTQGMVPHISHHLLHLLLLLLLLLLPLLLLLLLLLLVLAAEKGLFSSLAIGVTTPLLMETCAPINCSVMWPSRCYKSSENWET